jgi:Flp pilus assembly protein TadG
MTLRATLQRLAAQRRATTTVEFALVGSMMLLMTFGTLDLGMLLWTQNALQSTAALAARCSAISSPLCANVPNYAVTMAGNWVMPGVITAADVDVADVGTCNSAAGTFRQVTITSTFWVNVLPPPFPNQTLTARACYPVPP